MNSPNLYRHFKLCINLTVDKYEIISPLDLNNVWVRDKQSCAVCMWRRGKDNQDIEHQETMNETLFMLDKA
jgi:hypothetical protein